MSIKGTILLDSFITRFYLFRMKGRRSSSSSKLHSMIAILVFQEGHPCTGKFKLSVLKKENIVAI